MRGYIRCIRYIRTALLRDERGRQFDCQRQLARAADDAADLGASGVDGTAAGDVEVLWHDLAQPLLRRQLSRAQQLGLVLAQRLALPQQDVGKVDVLLKFVREGGEVDVLRPTGTARRVRDVAAKAARTARAPRIRACRCVHAPAGSTGLS